MGDLEHVAPPHVASESSQGTIEGEGSLLGCDLPRIASCKKPGVLGKPNAWKSLLTYTMYLANAMLDFAVGFAHVEEQKIVVIKEMLAIMIKAKQGDAKVHKRHYVVDCKVGDCFARDNSCHFGQCYG